MNEVVAHRQNRNLSCLKKKKTEVEAEKQFQTQRYELNICHSTFVATLQLWTYESLLQ